MYDSDLPERFDEMSEERKKYLLNWIKENFIPRKTFNKRYSSYGLKHRIKEYYTNGEFKGAMKAKCPIVPCALIDSFKPFDEKSIRPVSVKLIYLPPLYYEDYKDMKTVEIAAEVKRRIELAIEEHTAE